MADKDKAGAAGGLLSPIKHQLRGIAGIAGKLALAAAKRKVEQTTTRLTGIAEGGGLRTLGQLAGAEGGTGRFKGLAKMAWGGLKKKLGFGGGKGKKFKFLNIVESLDVGAPIRLTYNQWTQFQDFPSFMKKVEKVVQDSDEKLTWQAKIIWSRRTWESTISEQVPDDKIIWRSKGAKGYVDGTVTFHEITPDLTRILMVLEYHPKGFMEHIGLLWRVQGRRARLEFKHFRRHVMTESLLTPDEVEGWRGVIHEGEVVKDHETALREEQEREREERPEEGEHEGEEAEAEPEEGEEAEPEAEAEEGEQAEAAGPEEAEEEEGAEEPRERRHRPWSRRGERPERPGRAVPAEEGEPRARRRRPEPAEARRRRPESGEPGEPPARRRRPETAEGEEPAPRRPRREPEPRGR
ncbi:SRPBCC family protein [Sphaerisporangium sp. NPDC049002]|uniref:SRPBCC family protein n=1 Tax=unclassified Sphaerisporangium TaxID=2630420 RepID=UPI0033CB1683